MSLNPLMKTAHSLPQGTPQRISPMRIMVNELAKKNRKKRPHEGNETDAHDTTISISFRHDPTDLIVSHRLKGQLTIKPIISPTPAPFPSPACHGAGDLIPSHPIWYPESLLELGIRVCIFQYRTVWCSRDPQKEPRRTRS